MEIKIEVNTLPLQITEAMRKDGFEVKSVEGNDNCMLAVVFQKSE